MSLAARIESAITLSTGDIAKIRDSHHIHGGSINDARLLSLSDNRQFFVKTHPRAVEYPGMFALEFASLQKLYETGTIRVPLPVASDKDFIVMEAFISAERKKDWAESLGRQLAQLHECSQQDTYGFERDNYIGTTNQINTWSDSWPDFWREQRLGFQIHLFSSKTDKDDRLLILAERLMQKLDDYLLDIDEAAVLLHGDLWSGNAAADESGAPIIFDPASYYGHREAEIGMMRMFGGFGPRCEAAYAEVWPLAAGAEERIKLYGLYHELNHLNLFGAGYYQQCLSTMESLL